jgi:hypothetical protein
MKWIGSQKLSLLLCLELDLFCLFLCVSSIKVINENIDIKLFLIILDKNDKWNYENNQQVKKVSFAHFFFKSNVHSSP